MPRGEGLMAIRAPNRITNAPTQIHVTSGEISSRNVAGGGVAPSPAVRPRRTSAGHARAAARGEPAHRRGAERVRLRGRELVAGLLEDLVALLDLRAQAARVRVARAPD